MLLSRASLSTAFSLMSLLTSTSCRHTLLLTAGYFPTGRALNKLKSPKQVAIYDRCGVSECEHDRAQQAYLCLYTRSYCFLGPCFSAAQCRRTCATSAARFPKRGRWQGERIPFRHIPRAPHWLPHTRLASSHCCQASPEQVNAFFEGLLPQQKEHVTACRACAAVCAA